MTRPKRTALILAWFWPAVFFLLPFALVLKISISVPQLSVPPYGDLPSWESYARLFEDSIYVKAVLGSLKVAAVATLFTLILGYPMAYAIARAPVQHRMTLLVLVMLPFWTSFLIRIYAWITLLRPTGVINTLLQGLHMIDAPLHLLNTPGAVYLGIVYAYLPFMILPLYARLEKIDGALLEAAADLGATPWRRFLSVTLPLSLPGVVAGCLLVFIPAVGEFVIPELMGGPDTLMIGKVLWSEFFSNRDWPMSSAVAVVLLIVLVGPIMLFKRGSVMPRKLNPTKAVLAAGLLFLYLPLVVVMIYSFNASKLVTVWTGFSAQWYAELFADQHILDAALNSLIVALASASLAAVFGTLAGYVLARFGAFRTRTAFAGALAAPLVMPEIITGLSLLLLFVGAQQVFPGIPGRGLATIVIAHASLTFAYVAVIVQARLAGMDRAAEEAAADLGAKPLAAFVFVTLPMIAPAVAAGWLLAFVLSLDDLVIASFVSGPQSTTLPMVVFSSIRLGVSPKINALATLLIVATLVLLAVAAWLGRSGLKRR